MRVRGKGQPTRVLIGLFCGLIVASGLFGVSSWVASATTVVAVSPAASAKVVNISTSLRVRSSASTTGKVVHYLKNGTKLSVTGYTSTGWLRIASPAGYVSAAYVNVPVTSVTSDTTKSVATGAKAKISYAIHPACATSKGVTWTSSNTSVATVDSTGNVTGKAVGTATVTVKTSQGGYTAKTTVTVTGTSAPAVPVVTPSSTPTTTPTSTPSSTPTTTQTIPPPVNSAPPAVSTLALTGGMSVPNPLTPGKAVTVTGTVSSNYNLTNVTATIQTTSGVNKYGPFTVTPNALSYNLNKWDNSLLFSKLAVGSYNYIVSAKDSSGASKTLVSTAFNVGSPVAVTDVTVAGVLPVMTGYTQQLTATIKPTNASDTSVTWASSSTALATISATGLVTGKVTGTGKSADVTLTVNAANSKAGTATLHVYTVQDVQTKLNALACKDVNGKVLAVDGAYGTNSTYSLKSFQKAVGQAQNGVPGGATLTELFAAGAPKCGTVKTPTTAVSLDKPTTTLALGQSDTLTATVLPADATDPSLKWASSNANVATVTDGKITTTGPGTATVTVTTNNGSFTATCQVTVTIDGLMVISQTAIPAASINVGASITLTDQVWSNAALTSVTVGFKNSADGTWVSDDQPVAAPVSGAHASLAGLVAFNTLPAGSYVYSITAIDESGATQTWEQPFSVVVPPPPPVNKAANGCVVFSQAITADDQFQVPATYKGAKSPTALVKIAQSQVGYHEGTYQSDSCVKFPTDQNWTKYGYSFWGKSNGIAWCAAFVSWVARQAGYSTAQIPNFVSVAAAGATSGVGWYKAQGRFYTASSGYTPKPGDLIFYADAKTGIYYHTGIVVSVSGGKVNTVEGNSVDSTQVGAHSYSLTYADIGGYGSNS